MNVTDRQPRSRHDRRLSPRRRSAGFTMAELLVTVSIAAILAVVAVPSFSRLTASQRTKALASELRAALLDTRSEALRLNQPVTLSAKAGGWNAGCQILDVNGAVLEDRGPAPGVSVTPAPATVTYNPSGRLPTGTAPPILVISAATASTTNSQCVSVDLGGRPYVQAGVPTC